MPPRLSAFSSFSTFSPLRQSLPRHCTLARTPLRSQSQFSRFPGGGRRRPNYNRFGRIEQVKNLWSTNSNFRYGVFAVGAGGAGFIIYNIERVPISGRLRFNCVSENYERQTSNGMYQQAMAQYGRKILPPDHPDSRIVQKVMDRLIPASGLSHEGWEVKVIGDRQQKNAFVLPGGKVFVFSGILPICAGEDGLAAVLSHEIAHNVAHHLSEKISQQVYIVLFVGLLSWAFDASAQIAQLALDYAVQRPGSRQMETEADLLGLLMMAKSCYNPEGAVSFWQRMAKAEQFAPPQFVSTHPSSASRIVAIQQWLPRAQEARANSECGNTIGYADAFSKAFRDDPLKAGPTRRRSPEMVQEPPRSDDDDGFW